MATTRRWSRWLIGLGAHLACAVVAVAVVPFLIPVDHCRPLLEQVLSLEASRQGSITGLRLELWPRVHVRAARVHAKNPEGFPSGDAVTMHSVDLASGRGCCGGDNSRSRTWRSTASGSLS